MFLIPKEQFQIDVDYDQVEMLERLKSIVEPTKVTLIGNDSKESTKYYEGELAEYSFEIQRISVKMDKVLLPRVKGVYQNNRIEFRFEMNSLMRTIYFILSGLAILMPVIFLIIFMKHGTILPKDFLKITTTAVPAFLMISTFKHECKKTKSDLLQVLNS